MMQDYRSARQQNRHEYYLHPNLSGQKILDNDRPRLASIRLSYSSRVKLSGAVTHFAEFNSAYSKVLLRNIFAI